MVIVRENIGFKRGKSPRKALNIGLENNPWNLHDYLVKMFREKGLFVKKSERSFESNEYYEVIFNIIISGYMHMPIDSVLTFYQYKNHMDFKYGASNMEDGTIFQNDDWQEVVDFIEKNLWKLNEIYKIKR